MAYCTQDLSLLRFGLYCISDTDSMYKMNFGRSPTRVCQKGTKLWVFFISRSNNKHPLSQLSPEFMLAVLKSLQFLVILNQVLRTHVTTHLRERAKERAKGAFYTIGQSRGIACRDDLLVDLPG
jgi:hypothetical protein